MVQSTSEPSVKEAITFIDNEWAKHYLVMKLSEIPEFVELWSRARELPTVVMEAIQPKLQEWWSTMSPAGRGAYGALPGFIAGDTFKLYDRGAQQEAVDFITTYAQMVKTIDTEMLRLGIKVDYQGQLERLVEPLGVPSLEVTLMVLDLQMWKWDRLVKGSGPVEGPYRTAVETASLEWMTGLSPAELASETPGRIQARMRRKAAPLARHIKRYDLPSRIDLWVRHKVLGEPIAQITGAARSAEGGAESWTRQKIQEATRDLRAQVPPGRPPKGGVLRRWKSMI